MNMAQAQRLSKPLGSGSFHFGLGGKILIPALLVAILGTFFIYYLLGEKHSERLHEDLQARLRSFVATQAAELEGPVWEFDQESVDRLFRSYAQNGELLWAKLSDPKGEVLAEVKGAEPQVPLNTLFASRHLTHKSGSDEYRIGQLEVVFHDGQLRLAASLNKTADMVSLATLILILVFALGLTIHWQVGLPLRELRESLRRNAMSGTREPLVWQSNDEIGAVIDSYNKLLAEIGQNTLRLERVNLSLSRENAQRREVEAKLRLFKAAVDATDEAVVITDRHMTVIEINASCLTLTGFEAAEVLGRSVRATFLSSHNGAKHKAIMDKIAQESAWSGEIWGFSKAGRPLPWWATFNVLREESGQISHYVIALSDISKLKATQRQLRHLAYTDPLTSLPNRALFLDRLEQEISIDLRHDRRFALLFIDLDRFKFVNDTLGHSAGDEVLEILSQRMRESIRSEDTLARMGGDEFTIILRETENPEMVERLALKLIERIKRPIVLASMTLEIGASIGVAFFPEDGRDADAIMKNADTAMYAAKAEGGGTVGFFEPSIGLKAKAQLELQNRLKGAARNHEFVLHYQPIIDMESGKPAHLEALIRWKRDGGLVYPGEFIEFAEQSGIISHIGRWVLEESFSQIGRWMRCGIHKKVAVNISRHQFQDQGFAEGLIECADRHAIDKSSVVLEITESAIMTNPEKAKEILENLIQAGFRIAIDDFGSGYSSLSFLVEFPVHIVKLDRSLIKSLDSDQRGRSLVSGFIELFQSLGLEVVAEGVEMPGQHEFLCTAGCDLAQGWLYSKAMPAASAALWEGGDEGLILNCLDSSGPELGLEQ